MNVKIGEYELNIPRNTLEYILNHAENDLHNIKSHYRSHLLEAEKNGNQEAVAYWSEPIEPINKTLDFVNLMRMALEIANEGTPKGE